MRRQQRFSDIFFVGDASCLSIEFVFYNAGNAWIFFELLLLYCFLNVVEDVSDKFVAFALDVFDGVFETFYFIVVPNVNLFVHEEQFGIFGDDVSEVVFFDFSDFF